MNKQQDTDLQEMIEQFMNTTSFEEEAKLYREICIKIMDIKKLKELDEPTN